MTVLPFAVLSVCFVSCALGDSSPADNFDDASAFIQDIATPESQRGGHGRRRHVNVPERQLIGDKITSEWKSTEAGRSVRVHRDLSTLTSGAFAFGTHFHMMGLAVLEGVQIERALNNSGDVKSTSGLIFHQTGWSNGEGTLFRTEMDAGCEGHDEFGDTNCTVPWGTSTHFRGALLVEKEITEGATLTVKFRTKIQSLRPGGWERAVEKEVTCQACGAVCLVRMDSTIHRIETQPCDVGKGDYAFSMPEYTLPNDAEVKTFSVFSDVLFSLSDAMGSLMNKFHMHIETF